MGGGGGLENTGLTEQIGRGEKGHRDEGRIKLSKA